MRTEAPSNPAAIDPMVKGVRLANEGQREQAAVLLRQAVERDSDLWEARYDLGVVLASGGDLSGAEEQLAVAAKSAPDAEDVAVALAEVRRRRRQHKLAAAGLADFVRDHPAGITARTLYVAALRESGQIEQAIVEAREVLVRKPADATALAELALSYLAKGEKDAATLLAKQALEANPNSAVAHRATGLLDLANGDDAAAFGEFRKAAQADPHDTTSRLNMGAVLLRAGAYEKAEQQFREILSLSSEDAEAQVGLAAALRAQGDARHPQRFAQARDVLEKVLRADAHDTDALFNLGVLYADFLNKPADAAPLFKRFLADAPSDHPLRARAEKYAMATSAAASPQGGPPASAPPGTSPPPPDAPSTSVRAPASQGGQGAPGPKGGVGLAGGGGPAANTSGPPAAGGKR